MYYIGIDLGGTNVAAGVVTKDGEIIAKASTPTNAKSGTDAIISAIVSAVNEALDKANLSAQTDIISIGIGTPGTLDIQKGIVEHAANLGFENTPLAALVGKHFPGKPIYIENDANVAALAESVAGAAKGTKDSVIITLGTGVGGGIILGGKIYSGFNGRGGELGHTCIVADGKQCSCGRRGCWEAYASVSALIGQTKEAMDKNKDSLMWQLAKEKVSGRTAFDAMRKGDRAAKEVVDKYLFYVSVGITDVINMLQPEVISIGGGISKEGDTLLLPVLEHINRDMFSKCESKTKVCIAKLGNDAGIIGAASLGIR